MPTGPPIVITISGFGEQGSEDLLKWLKEMFDWERVILVKASTILFPSPWLDNDLHPGTEHLVRVEGWEWSTFPQVTNPDQTKKKEDWIRQGEQRFPGLVLIVSYPNGYCYHNGQEFQN